MVAGTDGFSVRLYCSTGTAQNRSQRSVRPIHEGVTSVTMWDGFGHETTVYKNHKSLKNAFFIMLLAMIFLHMPNFRLLISYPHLHWESNNR